MVNVRTRGIIHNDNYHTFKMEMLTNYGLLLVGLVLCVKFEVSQKKGGGGHPQWRINPVADLMPVQLRGPPLPNGLSPDCSYAVVSSASASAPHRFLDPHYRGVQDPPPPDPNFGRTLNLRTGGRGGGGKR